MELFLVKHSAKFYEYMGGSKDVEDIDLVEAENEEEAEEKIKAIYESKSSDHGDSYGCVCANAKKIIK